MKLLPLPLFAATFICSSVSFAQSSNQNPKMQKQPYLMTQSSDPHMGEQPELMDNSMKGSRLEMGADLAVLLPLGASGDELNTGFGLGIHASGNVTPNISIGGATGYARHTLKMYKEVKDLTGHVSVVPIVGVFKYALQSSSEGFYLGSDLGLYLVTIKLEMSSLDFTYSHSQTQLGMAPFVGYRLPFSGGFAANFAGKLQIVDTEGNESYKTIQALAGISKEF
jgi:hypothetical protein